MGRLIRGITSLGEIMAVALDGTDIVAKAEQIHKTSATATAALGRLLCAASMMGNAIKKEDGSITIKIAADGPMGTVMAVSDSHGNVRGYVNNPLVELPLNDAGKLDVSGGVGKNGILHVIKDNGSGEPFVGSVPLVSGEIAEDITSYYALSEQIPTVCALGVLVNPDLSVKAAGGYIIQLLPGADDACIDKLEASIEKMPPVSKMLNEGLSLEEMLNKALSDFEFDVLTDTTVEYKCNCSQKRVEKALISLGNKELEDMVADGKDIEIKCQFCDKVYTLSTAEIKGLIKK